MEQLGCHWKEFHEITSLSVFRKPVEKIQVPFKSDKNIRNSTLSPMYLYDSIWLNYRGADKSLARPTSRCILFDGKNISFGAGLVIYINSTNIPPILLLLHSALQPLVGFRPAQLSLSILSRKVLQSAVASGTSNPQLEGEPRI
jgi:hypothetical protein